MSVTSANINDLQTFLTGSQSRYERLFETLTTVSNKATTVMAASGGSEHPSTPSLGALNELLGAWQLNQAFVQVVRNELIEADQIGADGMASVASTEIDATLRAHALDQAPSLVEVPEIELYGQPPYSGFVDDPICLANGNFLLRDGDIELFGVASVLSVIRTYNSRDHRAGVFGAGWSSAVDVALAVGDREVTFRAADGSGAVFRKRADGSWTSNRRRRLRLVASDDGGWVVHEHHDRSWTFDADGTLTALTAGAADVAVERSIDQVRFDDRTSGRWVAYRFAAAGLASSVETSDGRTSTYRYDDGGRLVGVDRDRGAVTYEHDDAGFVSVVVDADGIVVCRNVYDAAGRVLSQVENHGRETRYEYRPDGVSTVTASDGAPPNVMVHDRRGRMTAMIDGLGNTMRMAYDDMDEIVQIVDRTGAVTRYDHDDRGNLIRRTDPDGLHHAYEWDEQDRLVADTDRAGATTRYHYEAERREPHRVVLADGSELHATFDERDLPTSVTDADGVSGRLEWNRDGLVTAVVDGLGARLTFEYDSAGRTVGAEAPEGISASAELDPAGRLRALRNADGERTFRYSPAGRLVGGRTTSARTWRTDLDAAGDPTVVADEHGRFVTVERDTVGRISATVAADGARTTFEHDPVGRRTATIDPIGGRTEIEYDPEGRPVQVTDPSGRTRSRDLDVLGRTTMAVAPDGATTIRSYHPHGQIASVTDAAGHTWSYDVDVMGRVTSSTDPLGGVTTYRYTPAGRLAEVVSPLGRAERREYDAAGRLERIVEADGTAVRFEHRADGSIRRITRNGVVTSLDYDESGRTSAIAGPWSSLSVEREAGRVTELSSRGTSAAHVRYDLRGLLASVTDPAGVVTDFARDACGRLVGQTTGPVASSFGWDGAGRLSSVTDAYGDTTAFERDARGAIERISRPDGSTTVRTFGPDGSVTGALDADGTELLSIRRDANGAIVGATSGGSLLELERDPLGRVTGVTTDAGSLHYRWDADGMLDALADADGWSATIDRSPEGRMLGFELGDGRRVDLPQEPVIERDEHGRITVDEHGRRYSYDGAGRLAAATDAEGETTAYDYDDLGLLAREVSSAGTRRYRYGRAAELTTQVHEDGTETTFTYDATGRRTSELHPDGTRVDYRWDALGRLEAVVRTAADGTSRVDSILVDPVGRPARINDVPVLWDSAATGSVLGIGGSRYLWSGIQVIDTTDPAGSWSRRVEGDAWGHDGGSGVRLGYRGELALDHLLFLGARVYDTRTRTFLSRDPLPSVPGQVSFAGIYAYASHDPVNMVDPSGQRPLSDDEYAEFREQASKGVFQKAWDAVAEDPWGWAAKGLILVGGVVVTAVAVATLGPVGVILVAGAVGAVSGALNTAIDGGSWGDIGRSALIGGVFGMATGGLAKFVPPSAATGVVQRVGSNTASQAVQNYGMATAQEAVDSYAWGGDGTMNWENAVINGTVGTVTGVTVAEVQYHGANNTANTGTGGNGPEPTGTGNAGSGIDDLDPPAMGHDSPEAAVPDPQRTLESFNGATAEQLQEAHGIGPVTAEAIVQHRANNGPFTSADDVLDVSGVGPARLQALKDAGLLP